MFLIMTSDTINGDFMQFGFGNFLLGGFALTFTQFSQAYHLKLQFSQRSFALVLTFTDGSCSF